MANPRNLLRVLLGSLILTLLLNVTLFRSSLDAATLSVLGESLRVLESGGQRAWELVGWRGGLLLEAYRYFGLGGLRISWILLQMGPTFLALFGLGLIWLGWRGWRTNPSPLVLRLEGFGGLAIFCAVLVYAGGGWARSSSPEEVFPGRAWLQEIAAATGENPVLANPTLRAKAALLAPELHCDPVQEMSEILREPSLWRDHVMASRPAAVVLSGRVEEYGPLLDYLLEAPDWELAEINQYGLLFFPQGRASAWQEGKVAVSAKIEPGGGVSTEGEAVRTALRLARESVYQTQAGYYGAARQLLEEAKTMAPDSAEVLALSAAFLAERGQWPEAATEAEAALALNPRLAAAWQIRLQSELAMQQPQRAAESARELESHAGADDFSWFLIARAANEGNDPALEIRALEELLRLSQLRNLPVGGYLIFLGQAYARQGFERQARSAWTEAMQSGSLTPAQEGQVGELLERLDSAPAGP